MADTLFLRSHHGQPDSREAQYCQNRIPIVARIIPVPVGGQQADDGA